MRIKPESSRPPSRAAHSDEYLAYLESDAWKDTRAAALIRATGRAAVSSITCYNVRSSKVPARCFSSRRRGTRMEVRMLEQSSLPSPAPEEWRPIAGFEGRYEVSSLGRVRSLRSRGHATFGSWDRLRPEPLILVASPGRGGYPALHLGRSPLQRVHHLVLKTFVGPRPTGYEGAHLNGVRDDNRLENLAWKTHAENEYDKVAHGTVARDERSGPHRHPERMARGEQHGRAKLTASLVLEIRAARAAGESERGVAARYGVSGRTVGRIVHREKWAHV